MYFHKLCLNVLPIFYFLFCHYFNCALNSTEFDNTIHSSDQYARLDFQENFKSLYPFSDKLPLDKNLKFKMGLKEDEFKGLTYQELVEKFKELIYQELKQKFKHKEQLINEPNFIDKLKFTKPYPNPGILGKLASKAYIDYEFNESLQEYEKRLGLPDGWKLLAIAYNSELNNGYFGAAYWNPESCQIVIAHRGTQLSNIGALYTDLIGIVFTNYVSQMSSASTFADAIVNTFNEINKEQKVNFQLFFTGHSLGGWLSQITTFTAKYLKPVDSIFQWNAQEGYHAHTVVFDSPGCRGMLLQMADTFSVRYSDSNSIDVNSLDITSYLSAVNRINTFGLHIGTVYQIDASDILSELHPSHTTDTTAMDRDDSNYISYILNNTSKAVEYVISYISIPILDLFWNVQYNLKTHKLKNILKIFDPETGQIMKDKDGNLCVVEILDFPISRVESSGGEEYKIFFSYAAPSNSFSPPEEEEAIKEGITEKSGYYPIRYQVKSLDEKVCNVRIFTQSEFLFLERYQQLRDLPKSFKPPYLFVDGKEEEVERNIKDALKDFKINHKSISCKNKEDLQQLIPYVKNLLCFFPNLSSSIETALSVAGIKEEIIKSQRLNYYQLLSKYFQDFTVDLELNALLRSTKQVSLLSVHELTYISLARIYKALNQKIAVDYKKEHIVLSSEGLLKLDEIIELVEFLDKQFSYSLILVECNSNLNIERNKKILADFFRHIFIVLKKQSEIKIILVAASDNSENWNDLFSSQTEELKLEYEFKNATPLTWNSLTSEFQNELLEKPLINFQGQKETSLKNLIGSDNVIYTKIITPEILVRLINEKQIIIGSKLPISSGYDESYYIERRLNYQTKINREVLKAKGKIEGKIDRFAISGIDQETLNTLTLKESNIHLFEDNNGNKDSSIRFTVLNNEQAKMQFEQLCKQYPEDNIHWLTYGLDSKSLIWQQSRGSLSIILEHIDTSYTDSYSELEWVNQENHSKIVIISDTAGMGKTTILTHLSHQIKSKTPNLWMVRIDLNDHTSKLKEKKENGSFKPQNIDVAVAFLANDLLNLSTSFEQALFKVYCQHTGKLIVMFDGFDEISPSYKETVIDLMKALRKSRIEQLWVTTRPYMRIYLENELQQFAYTLKPFSENDQKEFLTKFWVQNLNLSKGSQKLKECANALIELLAKSISDKERKFAGIPLQTIMLAEAFTKECETFHKSDQMEPALPETLDLINLYELFFKNKYDIYQVIKNKIDVSKPGAKRQTDALYEKFIKEHQSMALYTLFEKKESEMLLTEKFYQELSAKYPSVAQGMPQQEKLKELLFKDKQEEIDALIENIKEGKERTGIIDQIVENKPHFIHRTFAEYLVANFLVNSLKQPIQSAVIQEFLIKKF